MLSGFRVSHLSETEGGLRIGAGSACCGRHAVVDQLIVANGFRPDLDFLRELRLLLDHARTHPVKAAEAVVDGG